VHWFIGWEAMCMDCGWEGLVMESLNSAHAEAEEHIISSGCQRVYVGKAFEPDEELKL
jgi:hypothetical protein